MTGPTLGRTAAADVLALLRMSVLSHGVTAAEGRAYTFDFRVFGMLHLRSSVPISRYLNLRDRPYVAMTSCIVYREGYDYPPAEAALLYRTSFAALPKTRLLWVVGGQREREEGAHSREPRFVYVMYPNYVLSGKLYLPPRLRVSDYLAQAFSERPFQELVDVEVLKPRAGAEVRQFEVVERLDFAVVNVAAAGGLFEDEKPPGRAFRIEE